MRPVRPGGSPDGAAGTAKIYGNSDGTQDIIFRLGVEDSGGADWDNFSNHGRKLIKAATSDERSCYANSALSGTDQECLVTHAVAEFTNVTQSGSACRRSNSVVTFYFNQLTLTSSTKDLKIKKMVAGTATVLGSI